MAEFLDSLDAAVARMLERLPAALHVGAPLGLGKPHRLLNALYARVAADPSRPMTLYTALSLDPPRAAPGEATPKLAAEAVMRGLFAFGPPGGWGKNSHRRSCRGRPLRSAT